MHFKSIKIFISLFFILTFSSIRVHSDPLVPALFIFGDSNVDVGNNNKLPTTLKANLLPYGRDFVTHSPTGRFSNGKLMSDFIAEALGFPSYPPPYLSEEAYGKNLLIGSNFASGGSGYCETMSKIYGVLPLSLQLQYFKDYQHKLSNLIGKDKANVILSDAIFILSAGTTDFIGYYFGQHLNKFKIKDIVTLDHFMNILLISYSNFIETLYLMGARKIGVVSVPPVGCIPAIITILGGNQCIDSANEAANLFNIKLNKTTEVLKANFPDLRILVLDSYTPLLDIIKRPELYGFSQTRRGCCGLGLIELSALLCNPLSFGTCPDASQYVFWDGVHTTQALNKVLAAILFQEGAPLIP